MSTIVPFCLCVFIYSVFLIKVKYYPILFLTCFFNILFGNFIEIVAYDGTCFSLRTDCNSLCLYATLCLSVHCFVDTFLPLAHYEQFCCERACRNESSSLCFISSEYIPRSETAALSYSSFFFLKILYTVFRDNYIDHNPIKSCAKVLIFLHSLQHLLFSRVCLFFKLSYLCLLF